MLCSLWRWQQLISSYNKRAGSIDRTVIRHIQLQPNTNRSKAKQAQSPDGATTLQLAQHLSEQRRLHKRPLSRRMHRIRPLARITLGERTATRLHTQTRCTWTPGSHLPLRLRIHDGALVQTHALTATAVSCIPGSYSTVSLAVPQPVHGTLLGTAATVCTRADGHQHLSVVAKRTLIVRALPAFPTLESSLN